MEKTKIDFFIRYEDNKNKIYCRRKGTYSSIEKLSESIACDLDFRNSDNSYVLDEVKLYRAANLTILQNIDDEGKLEEMLQNNPVLIASRKNVAIYGAIGEGDDLVILRKLVEKDIQKRVTQRVVNSLQRSLK